MEEGGSRKRRAEAAGRIDGRQGQAKAAGKGGWRRRQVEATGSSGKIQLRMAMGVRRGGC
eukprot:CAMPEP_0194291954 /NCGR_PEP_ID=MMETSP0169-20130528/44560_1 /TAXON_ID=218684 /ORGANISM="Corethron pennatum, Strain L29A3" /LENGTH=59 /DNA_ID=CAMNT_0039039985 /DNA_START=252 /DNA_END=431 /DNA_ORIENTATION=+